MVGGDTTFRAATRPERFARDVAELRQWAQTQGRRLVLHRSIGWATRGKPEELLGELVHDDDGAQRLLEDDSSALAVVFGSQLGVPLMRDAAAVLEGREIAVASGSVLSGNYVGITVRRVVDGGLTEPIVAVRDGILLDTPPPPPPPTVGPVVSALARPAMSQRPSLNPHSVSEQWLTRTLRANRHDIWDHIATAVEMGWIVLIPRALADILEPAPAWANEASDRVRISDAAKLTARGVRRSTALVIVDLRSPSAAYPQRSGRRGTTERPALQSRGPNEVLLAGWQGVAKVRTSVELRVNIGDRRDRGVIMRLINRLGCRPALTRCVVEREADPRPRLPRFSDHFVPSRIATDAWKLIHGDLTEAVRTAGFPIRGDGPAPGMSGPSTAAAAFLDGGVAWIDQDGGPSGQLEGCWIFGKETAVWAASALECTAPKGAVKVDGLTVRERMRRQAELPADVLSAASLLLSGSTSAALRYGLVESQALLARQGSAQNSCLGEPTEQ